MLTTNTKNKTGKNEIIEEIEKSEKSDGTEKSKEPEKLIKQKKSKKPKGNKKSKGSKKRAIYVRLAGNSITILDKTEIIVQLEDRGRYRTSERLSELITGSIRQTEIRSLSFIISDSEIIARKIKISRVNKRAEVKRLIEMELSRVSGEKESYRISYKIIKKDKEDMTVAAILVPERLVSICEQTASRIGVDEISVNPEHILLHKYARKQGTRISKKHKTDYDDPKYDGQDRDKGKEKGKEKNKEKVKEKGDEKDKSRDKNKSRNKNKESYSEIFILKNEAIINTVEGRKCVESLIVEDMSILDSLTGEVSEVYRIDDDQYLRLIVYIGSGSMLTRGSSVRILKRINIGILLAIGIVFFNCIKTYNEVENLKKQLEIRERATRAATETSKLEPEFYVKLRDIRHIDNLIGLNGIESIEIGREQSSITGTVSSPEVINKLMLIKSFENARVERLEGIDKDKYRFVFKFDYVVK